MAQDDYYYEIQLTNKQLIFYFMAGAAGLILSFLAGVMVGRGVEGGSVAAAGTETARVVEEKVVPEPAPTPTEYTYPQRLESDRVPEGLERPAAAPAAATPSPRPVPTPAAARPLPTPAAARPLPTPPARAAAAPVPAPAGAAAGLPRPLGPSAKGFAVQVGAFKDRAGAEAIVRSLKGRGLPAFTVAPAAGSAGLYTVRVGVYRDRADAEIVVERLRDDKFQPYVLKQ